MNNNKNVVVTPPLTPRPTTRKPSPPAAKKIAAVPPPEPPVEDPNLIPRLIHFYWVGRVIPYMALDMVERAREVHPNWTVKLWRGVPPEMPDDVRAMLYTTKYVTCRSDVFRWWALYEYGGFYLDTDVYCYRNFEPLRTCQGFVAHPPAPKSRGLPVAVIGAPPKSKMFGWAMDELRELHEMVVKNGGHSRLAYGPALMQKVWHKHKDEIECLPRHYFYLFLEHPETMKFVQSNAEEQSKMIELMRPTFPDKVDPFGVHIWGMPTAPFNVASTHFLRPAGYMDKILMKLPNGSLQGGIFAQNAVWGVDYCIGHRPDIAFPKEPVAHSLDFLIVQEGHEIPMKLLKPDGLLFKIDVQAATSSEEKK